MGDEVLDVELRELKQPMFCCGHFLSLLRRKLFLCLFFKEKKLYWN